MVGDELKEFFEMDKSSFYRALVASENRAVARTAALLEAQRVCTPHLSHLSSMAFDAPDTPEDYYRSALTTLGVAPQDMEDLDLAALKAVFKIKTNGANLEGTPTFNVRSNSSTLDNILAGVTSPQLTAGLGLTGYTGNEATAATSHSRGMAGDSKTGGSPLEGILRNIGAKTPVNMSEKRRSAW